MRRVFALMAVGVMVLGGTVDVVDAAGESKLVLMLERTTNGPSRYTLDISVDFEDPGAFVAAVDARMEAGRIVDTWPGWASSFGREESPSVSAMGTRVSVCVEAGVCTGTFGQAGLTSFYIDEQGGFPINRAFFAAWGQNIEYTFEAEGWRLHEVGWDFRFVDGTESKSVSVDIVAGDGAELFFDAEARGGAHGSIAVGAPPCSTANLGIPPRGVGRVVLQGGVNEETVICLVPPRTMSSWATGATQWRLSGAAAGDTTINATRLFVLDFPSGFLKP